MHAPKLRHTSFAILSGLLDGRWKTAVELRDDLDWFTTQETFAQTTRNLHVAGLIDKARVCRRSANGKAATVRALRINAAGRQAWQENVDFYLWAANKFSAATAAADDSEIVDVELFNAATPAPVTDREATPAEFQRLLSIASPQFARFYRVMRLAGVRICDLTRLNVDDVDWSAETIRLNRLTVAPLKGPLLKLLREAAGNRASGPLFLDSDGNCWNPVRLCDHFAKLRRQLGIPKSVKLRGRRQPRKQFFQ
jgi:integrase